MLELIKANLQGQYEATLSALRHAIADCPHELWMAPVDKFPIWHTTYHALFYTDLYLSQDVDTYTTRDFAREDYHYFGTNPRTGEPVVADNAYTREELLAYVDLCRDKVAESLERETEDTLRGPCGFWWYSIGRFEFHINNIRHLQHHASQLNLRRQQAGEHTTPWFASGWKPGEST